MKNKKARKQNHFRMFSVSLLILLIGVFLLPKLAFLSTISSENLIKLTNRERIANGIDILTVNELLSKAAQAKAEEIIKTNTFNHTINEKSFSNWIKNTGYEYAFVGENLAINFISGEGVLKAWMDSETHKNNILNQNFTEIGIAVVDGVYDKKNTSVIVQVFGAPLMPAKNMAIAKKDSATIERITLNPDYEFNKTPVMQKTVSSYPLFTEKIKNLLKEGGKINLLALNYLIFLILLSVVFAIGSKLYAMEKFSNKPRKT